MFVNLISSLFFIFWRIDSESFAVSWICSGYGFTCMKYQKVNMRDMRAVNNIANHCIRGW